MKKAVITILAVFLAFQLYAEQKCFKRSQNTLLYDEVMQNREPETMESVSAQSDSPVDSGDEGSTTTLADVPENPSTSSVIQIFSSEPTLTYHNSLTGEVESSVTHTGDDDSHTFKVLDKNGDEYGLDLNDFFEGDIVHTEYTSNYSEYLDNNNLLNVSISKNGYVDLEVTDYNGNQLSIYHSKDSSSDHDTIQSWIQDTNEKYGDTSSFIETY